MDIVQLKLELVESEKIYRDRFFNFVEILKRAADESEFFKQTKTKTILRISQEVLKCSEDLLPVLENRRRISHQSEAIYQDLEVNHFRAVGIIRSYCTLLLDIRALLLSSKSAGSSELQLPRLMKEALQPVLHLEEILGLLQQINEHLVANRRQVEIFSCNSLIDHLTKGLERARRAIVSLHSEELLLILEEISSKAASDIDTSALASASLADDSTAGNTEKLFEKSIGPAEQSPTANRVHGDELERENGAVYSDCDEQPMGDQDVNGPGSHIESSKWTAKSRRAGTQLVEERLEMPENVLAAGSLAEDVDENKNKKQKVFESSEELPGGEDYKAELGGENGVANSACDVQYKMEMEIESLRIVNESSHHSAQTRSIGNQKVEFRLFDMPIGQQLKKKTPIPSPRTRRTVTSVQSDRVSLTSADVVQSQPVLLRRESKKLIRSEVQSIALKISALRGNISSLEKKLDRLGSSESSESSGSGDGNTNIDTEDFPEVFEKFENGAGSWPPDATECSRVVLRSETTHYDAGMRDRRTKHLLHSTIWQVPLYQEYHFDVNAGAEASGLERETSQGNPHEAEEANSVDDLESNSRPESGIELVEEAEEEGEETVECYYTPMWNNGSELVEYGRKSTDYATMPRTRNSNWRSFGTLTPDPKEYAWLGESTDDSSSPSRSSTLIYMEMCRTYANVRKGSACETQTEGIYSSVHDIFGAVQVDKLSASQEEVYGREVNHCVPITRAKQLAGWCNIPAVRDSGLLEFMTKKQRHLQEAKYELISSKVSYLKSLSILQAVFIENANLKRLMTSTEWNNLFHYIGPIKKCSEHFLADLLSGWPQDILMNNQLSVVRQYALAGLQTYVNYCSNKVTMDKTLANIRANNPKVNNALNKLESDEICDGNTLESFLVLPVQRITRFPLLIEGIIQRLDINTDKDFCAWAKTYRELKQMAKQCNDAVEKFDDATKVLPAERSADVCTSKTLPKNRMSTAFRKPSKSSTLPKRQSSTIWHDDD